MATQKQKKAMANLVENCGNVSKSMRQAGYKNASAKNPKVLTESKGWQELIEEYLPDTLLAKVGREGLQATREGSDREEEPDHAIRHRYLDTALKIKNKYPSSRLDLTSMGEKIIGIEMIIPDESNKK